MGTQQNRTPIMPFLGAFVGSSAIFGTWTILAFFESCTPNWFLATLHCDHTFELYFFFACGILILTAIVAWVTSIIYYPVLPFPSSSSELPSAMLFNVVLGVMSYGLIRWTMDSPDISGPFFDWLGVSLLVCAMLLILVNHLSRKNGES